jgi:hypothetical protein
MAILNLNDRRWLKAMPKNGFLGNRPVSPHNDMLSNALLSAKNIHSKFGNR